VIDCFGEDKIDEDNNSNKRESWAK
jgi:hypothetical protein